MDSLTLRQGLFERVRMRGRDGLDPVALGWPGVETMQCGGERLHFVTDPVLTRRLLANASFRTFPQAAVLKTMCTHFGLDGAVADGFFARSPIFLDGEPHRAERRRFARLARLAQEGLAARLDSIVDAHFEAMSCMDSRAGLATEGAVAFVDRVLAAVFEYLLPGSQLHYRSLAAHPQSLFEVVHHPRRLRGTLDAMAAFMGHYRGDEEALARAWALMGFVLMGRDPLVGGLADFLHLCREQPDARRARWLAGMQPRDVFRMTRPVNFVSRVASRPLEEPGLDVREHELVVFLLMARDGGGAGCPGMRDDLAFGHGPHMCIGMPLSLELTGAWLSGVKRWEKRIQWLNFQPEEPVLSVFRRYIGSGSTWI